jgi:hypothetical protein
VPYKINNAEQIVGTYADSDHLYHGFLHGGMFPKGIP